MLVIIRWLHILLTDFFKNVYYFLETFFESENPNFSKSPWYSSFHMFRFQGGLLINFLLNIKLNNLSPRPSPQSIRKVWFFFTLILITFSVMEFTELAAILLCLNNAFQAKLDCKGTTTYWREMHPVGIHYWAKICEISGHNMI